MSYRITDEQLDALQACLSQTLSFFLERSPDSELNEATSESLSILETVKSQTEEESVGGWIAEDMQTVCQWHGFTISDEDAERLLEEVEDEFDASIGMDWDTIWFIAEEMAEKNTITLEKTNELPNH